MKQIKLHETAMRLLPIALSVLWNGCTGDPSRYRGEDYGIDESYACPEGYVGFNFSKTKVDTRSEYYQNRLGDAAVAPLPSAGKIAIQDVTCTGTDKFVANTAYKNAYLTCEGKTTCQLSTPPAGCGDRIVTYTCGVASANDAGVQPEKKARATEKMDCSGAGKKLEIAAEARTLCVPRQCPIDTHRDENLNCVPDASMPGLESAWINSERLESSYATSRSTGSAYTSKSVDLYRHTPYEVELKMYAKELAKGTPPSRASVTYWLADVYVPKGSKATWSSDEAVLVFRCTAFNVEVARTKDAYTSNETHIIPETCFDANEQMQKELARRTGVDKPETRYTRLETRLFHSFDVQGRIALERASLASWGGKTSFDDTVASPCAPNPLEFFYDAESKSFDMVRFHQQRSIDEDSGTYRDANASRVVVMNDGAPAVAHLVAEDIKLGKAEVIVGQGPVATDPLPVDVKWSMPNYDPRNPLVPGNACSGRKNGWNYQLPRTPEEWAAQGGIPKFCNWAPPNLRADVYIAVKSGTPPLLGSIPLTGGSSEGVTANGDLRFSRQTRAAFFDASSPLYISPQQKSRPFTVFYCFGMDHPEATIDVRQWMTRQNCNDDNYDKDCDIDPEMSAKSGGQDWYLRVTDAKSLPKGTVSAGTGCVASQTPLVVTADRLIRPIEPVLGTAFGGDNDDTSSGGGSMSATQTNSSEVSCTDKGEQNCTEVVGGSMKSKGELGRSYFSVEGTLDRKQGRSVESDFTGEMLGMRVFDMADPEGDTKASWPGKPSNKKVTLKVEIPLDKLETKLKRATVGTPVEWSKGKYAGVIGLGVGIGYKVPFNVGPIPGLITISASVGVAAEVEAELKFAPDEGEQYPCIGTKRCYEVSSEKASQSDASAACTERGGRLAELSSATEATELEAALTGKTGSFWIGGQMAFEYENPVCLGLYSENICKSKATSSYRWLSNDVEFAKATGAAAATYVDKTFFGSKKPTLYTKLPSMAGLTYAQGGTTSLVAASEENPYVCVFEPASSASYLSWSLALKLGIGAGVGLSVCSPNDDIGFCLGGELNVVSTGVAPTWSNEYYWLSRNGAVKRRTGKTGFSVPWHVTLLEGALYAEARAYIVSARWNIVEFEGFKLAEGNLLSFEYPFQVDY